MIYENRGCHIGDFNILDLRRVKGNCGVLTIYNKLKMITKCLKRLSVLLEKKQNNVFQFDVKKQIEYIEKFREPKDGIERSFFQYKCQMKLYGLGISFILNLASFPIALALVIRYITKKVPVKRKEDAVFIRDGLPENILPESLKWKYGNINISIDNGNKLITEDVSFICKVFFRYPLSWLFILKNIIKISQYRYILDSYNPNAIIVCSEYSFTSSLMTQFCEKNDVLHIDVMHGEKFIYMGDSFFEFHECYVWDEHYKNIFLKLRADECQFVIEKPNSICFNKKVNEKTVDYTYYLGSETDEALYRISYALKQLSYNNKVVVRPHPRYSDLEKIRKYLGFLEMESVDKISIEDSILRTSNVVAQYSTVLTQALYNNVKIVIDDYSTPGQYEKLNELEFIVVRKPHIKLTDIICGNN